jgi:hypothetical protein
MSGVRLRTDTEAWSAEQNNQRTAGTPQATIPPPYPLCLRATNCACCRSCWSRLCCERTFHSHIAPAPTSLSFRVFFISCKCLTPYQVRCTRTGRSVCLDNATMPLGESNFPGRPPKDMGTGMNATLENTPGFCNGSTAGPQRINLHLNLLRYAVMNERD